MESAKAAVQEVGKTLIEERYGTRTSQRKLDHVNKSHKRRTNMSIGVSVKRCRKVEKESRSQVKARLQQGLTGAFKILEEEGWRESVRQSSVPLVGVLYTDGYTARNSLRSRNARTRLSMSLVYPETGGFVPSVTVVDRKKTQFKHFENRFLNRAILRLHNAKIVRGHGVTRVQIQKITGDHFDRWQRLDGCGGRGHRCAICAVPTSEWSLYTHRFPHLSLAQMAAAGYTSLLSAVAPSAHYVSPALHDIKGMGLALFKELDAESLSALQDLCSTLTIDVSQNATGAHVRKVVSMMAQRELPPTFRWLFISLSDLADFRYSDVPWRYWGQKEIAAHIPFLRARFSAHIFLHLMESVRRGASKNAYCHSLNHWWDCMDALPLQCSDEAEEAENGERKADVPVISSPQTCEVDLACAEEKRRARRLPWKVADLSQTGFRGKQIVLICDCLHRNVRSNLALVVLCDQLAAMKSNFVFRGGPYTAFRFPGGTGTIRVCVCKAPTAPPQLLPFVPDKNLTEDLVQRAQKELEEAGDEASEECEEQAIDDESEKEEEDDEEEEEEEEKKTYLQCDFCAKKN